MPVLDAAVRVRREQHVLRAVAAVGSKSNDGGRQPVRAVGSEVRAFRSRRRVEDADGAVAAARREVAAVGAEAYREDLGR